MLQPEYLLAAAKLAEELIFIHSHSIQSHVASSWPPEHLSEYSNFNFHPFFRFKNRNWFRNFTVLHCTLILNDTGVLWERSALKWTFEKIFLKFVQLKIISLEITWIILVH